MASEYHYLVATANEVFVLLNRSSTPTLSELTESANLCCNTLRRLSNDELFFRDVATLSERQRSNLFAFRQITGADTNSLSHFQYFWEHEKTLLISAGMYEDLVRQISSVVEEKIQSVRRGRLSVDNLQEEEEIREIERRIRRILYAIVGAAIIAIDASSLVSTVGLTAPGTAVSGAVGGGLIGAAIPPI